MYKLVLLDYSMPDLDGPQVTIEIKNLFKQSILVQENQIPNICCCTAYAEESFKK